MMMIALAARNLRGAGGRKPATNSSWLHDALPIRPGRAGMNGFSRYRAGEVPGSTIAPAKSAPHDPADAKPMLHLAATKPVAPGLATATARYGAGLVTVEVGSVRLEAGERWWTCHTRALGSARQPHGCTRKCRRRRRQRPGYTSDRGLPGLAMRSTWEGARCCWSN